MKLLIRRLQPPPPNILSQSLCTTPTLDSADFRGHRLTYLEKVYENKMDPRGVSRAINYSKQKNQKNSGALRSPLHAMRGEKIKHNTNIKMGMRAPPASRCKGAGRRPDGGTGIRTSRNKTKQNKTDQPGARAPTRVET